MDFRHVCDRQSDGARRGGREGVRQIERSAERGANVRDHILSPLVSGRTGETETESNCLIGIRGIFCARNSDILQFGSFLNN